MARRTNWICCQQPNDGCLARHIAKYFGQIGIAQFCILKRPIHPIPLRCCQKEVGISKLKARCQFCTHSKCGSASYHSIMLDFLCPAYEGRAKRGAVKSCRYCRGWLVGWGIWGKQRHASCMLLAALSYFVFYMKMDITSNSSEPWSCTNKLLP